MGASGDGRYRELVAPTSPVIPIELLVFGVWGLTAPYLGGVLGLVLDVRPIVEVADHVVPGIAIIAVAVAALITGRRWFVTSMVALAAGLWMTATHIPLLVQAANGEADLVASVFHSLPGVVVLVLGAAASLVDARSEAATRRAEALTGRVTDAVGEKPQPPPPCSDA